MAKLFGAQRLILQAISDLPKHPSGFVSDAQIADTTRISVADVRDWIETLESEGYVEAARTMSGLMVSITASGKLQLALVRPISSLTSESDNLAEQVDENAISEFQIVLLIHGIRTQADWGPMVCSKLEVPGQIVVVPIRYGYFDAFRFWFPFWTRNKPVEKIYVQIRVALQKFRSVHPDARLSLIAHSFGTYVIGQILRRGFDLRVHRLILCGSILPQDFPWEQYQGRFEDDKVVNECCKDDIWPVLAQSASWGYGASGTYGFGAILVKDRFHAGSHSRYFEPEFVEKYWVPFIRRGEYRATDFEMSRPTTAWWVQVLGILPLKFLMLFIALAAVASVILDLFHGLRIALPSSTIDWNWIAVYPTASAFGGLLMFIAGMKQQLAIYPPQQVYHQYYKKLFLEVAGAWLLSLFVTYLVLRFHIRNDLILLSSFVLGVFWSNGVQIFRRFVTKHVSLTLQRIRKED